MSILTPRALATCAVSCLVCGYLAYHLDVGRKVVSSAPFAGVIANIQEGLRVVRNDPVLVATLLVTVVYNLFGFPMLSLIP